MVKTLTEFLVGYVENKGVVTALRGADSLNSDQLASFIVSIEIQLNKLKELFEKKYIIEK